MRGFDMVTNKAVGTYYVVQNPPTRTVSMFFSLTLLITIAASSLVSIIVCGYQTTLRLSRKLTLTGVCQDCSFLRSHAMFSPSVFMVCIPSASFSASPISLPKATFQ